MKVKADWLQNAGAKTVCAALNDAGFKAYFVGGCVRNALLDAPASDIDLATDALPEQVLDIAKNSNLRAIPTGIEHGTVTVVADDEPIEITTFRKDVETDGRRAVVAFSKDIKDDALRRDFTMNALYADISGTVYDPLDGMEDLKNRHVQFIEDAHQRIREDYLRILRFFRFHAIYGDPAGGIDADALDACASNLDGIETLSKERIGHEMRKLLAADDPAPSLASMSQSGVLMRVIAGANTASVAPLVHLENMVKVKPNWMRRLLALGGEDVQNALRLSKKEAQLLSQMNEVVIEASSAKVAGHILGIESGRDAMLVLAAHMGMPVSDTLEQDLQAGAEAIFPIKSADLSDHYQGATLGKRLKQLKAAWLASDLNMTQSALLALPNGDDA
ncbi:CCA tRNA nucleotidyltransferase [Amylibacter sp. SFDW26]|nr:CCA tRNA nucleotidyltransferase [Amylibacter sp. SFDW26]KAB7614855.1 CCA tRNA nucleotidyltransferase [Amylibacter sp. SFDW26]